MSASIRGALAENREDIGGYVIFINVWNMAASLAVARPYRNERGQYIEEVRHFDDLNALGLTYEDLTHAIGAQGGRINLSGWYRLTPKICEAVNAHAELIPPLFAGGA